MPHGAFVDSVNRDIPWIKPVLWVQQCLPLVFDLAIVDVYYADLADTRTISVGGFHVNRVKRQHACAFPCLK